jgi:hypothetical protein
MKTILLIVLIFKTVLVKIAYFLAPANFMPFKARLKGLFKLINFELKHTSIDLIQHKIVLRFEKGLAIPIRTLDLKYIWLKTYLILDKIFFEERF